MRLNLTKEWLLKMANKEQKAEEQEESENSEDIKNSEEESNVTMELPEAEDFSNENEVNMN